MPTTVWTLAVRWVRRRRAEGAGKETHRNCAARAVPESGNVVDDGYEIERLRGDVGVATTQRAAQITK
jgi:hypothetical protein